MSPRPLIPLLAGLLLGVTAVLAAAFDQVGPTQQRTNSNQITSATAGIATVTLTGVTNKIPRVYAVAARCSSGTASITIVNGVTTVWDDVVGTSGYRLSFAVPVTGTASTTMTVNLSSCGGGNLGTLSVQADIY